MPELEFALLAEYVRQDRGLAYITAANLDTLTTDRVPAPWNLALFLGLRFRDDEASGQPFPVVVTLRSGEQRLVEIQAEIRREERAADVPADWPVRVTVPMNFGIVLPDYGVYHFDVALEGEVSQTLPIRVIAPQPDASA